MRSVSELTGEPIWRVSGMSLASLVGNARETEARETPAQEREFCSPTVRCLTVPSPFTAKVTPGSAEFAEALAFVDARRSIGAQVPGTTRNV